MAGKRIDGRHPVTVAIDSAIDWLKARGQEVTPDAVKANAKRRLRWEDWSFEEASDEALSARIARRLKASGHIVASDEQAGGRVRKDFWEAGPSELRKQLEVQEQSSRYDRNRIKANKAVITFLEEKERELGYEPYPGLFHDEVDRIYRMHGLVAPGARAAA